MSTNGARLGQGNITFTLGNETIELKPTLHAFQTISRNYGGVQDAMEKVRRLDINVIHDIIVLGSGNKYNSPRERQGLLEKIFEAGVAGDGTDEIGEKALKYLLSLVRGGRPEVQGEAATGGPEGNPPRSS